MYDNLFEDPEKLLEKRLLEDPGDENITLKEAGFRNVWSPFIEDVIERDVVSACRRFSQLEKVASDDPFIEGQIEAVDRIEEIFSSDYNQGWYTFIKEAASEDNLKNFANNLEDEEIELELEKKSGFLDARDYALEFDTDLQEMIIDGPNFLEKNDMFELGKEAALEEIAELADNGFGINDVLERIDETLNSDHEKIASEEDLDYLHGVESACHEFLKVANEVYGTYDTEGAEDIDVFVEIFEKIAATPRSYADGYDAIFGKSKSKSGTPKILRQVSGNAATGRSMNPAQGAGSKKRGRRAANAIKSKAGKAADAVKGMSRKQKGGVAAGTLAAATAAGLGARHLRKRKKAKEEREKKASFEDGVSSAYEDLIKIAEDGYGMDALLEIVSDTIQDDMNKEASEFSDDYWLGVESACFEFMKTASEIAGAFDIEDSYEFGVDTLNSMYEPGEFDVTEEFAMGKEAALMELAETADAGATVGDLSQICFETLESDLEKEASEEDLDYRRGIEAACFDFLKNASEIYGEYETSDEYEEDIAIAVFEKIARSYQEGWEATFGSGSADNTKRQRAVNAVKGMSGKQKAGVAAGTLAAAAAAGYGAKKLKQKKKKKEQGAKGGRKSRGQQKNASLTQGSHVEEALDVLMEAGLLDD